ncbi:unnamed protein product [Allacma fusca]|uniref:Uncharacterized protein n=1 Tax=Allacma fusca TaxID=39272 RepID=A0A8J2L137_9HEXA|nr:unnamed protein product [Allacma fusca]
MDKSLEETSTGKVLQVGSRAKISKVVADLASKASELSILENEELPRKGRTFKRLNKRKGTNSEEIAQSKTYRLEEFEGVQQENLDGQAAAEDNVEENFLGGQELIGLLSDVQESTENNTFPNSEAPNEKDKIIQALQLKLRKQDRCIKKLQSEIARNNEAEENAVDIGDGILVSKRFLSDLKMDYRHNPGIFLRKLMEKSGLFTLEESANSSVTGQRYRDGSQKPRFYNQEVQVE